MQFLKANRFSWLYLQIRYFLCFCWTKHFRSIQTIVGLWDLGQGVTVVQRTRERPGEIILARMPPSARGNWVARQQRAVAISFRERLGSATAPHIYPVDDVHRPGLGACVQACRMNTGENKNRDQFSKFILSLSVSV